MKNVLKKPVVQTLIASLICIVLGLLIGYIVALRTLEKRHRRAAGPEGLPPARGKKRRR